MKKTLIFLGVIAAMAFTSCKKDRTCECKETSTQPGYTPSTETFTMTDVNKKSAKVECLSYSFESDYTGTKYTYTTTCEIK